MQRTPYRNVFFVKEIMTYLANKFAWAWILRIVKFDPCTKFSISWIYNGIWLISLCSLGFFEVIVTVVEKTGGVLSISNLTQNWWGQVFAGQLKNSPVNVPMYEHWNNFKIKYDVNVRQSVKARVLWNFVSFDYSIPSQCFIYYSTPNKFQPEAPSCDSCPSSQKFQPQLLKPCNLFSILLFLRFGCIQ